MSLLVGSIVKLWCLFVLCCRCVVLLFCTYMCGYAVGCSNFVLGCVVSQFCVILLCCVALCCTMLLYVVVYYVVSISCFVVALFCSALCSVVFLVVRFSVKVVTTLLRSGGFFPLAAAAQI